MTLDDQLDGLDEDVEWEMSLDLGLETVKGRCRSEGDREVGYWVSRVDSSVWRICRERSGGSADQRSERLDGYGIEPQRSLEPGDSGKPDRECGGIAGDPGD